MTLSLKILILAAIVSQIGDTAFAEDPPAEAKPVVITTADLDQLSLSTRQELQELIDRKKENPPPQDLNIKVGRQGAIFEGDLTPGRTEIRILGRAIRVGERRNRPRAQIVAVYDENAPLVAPQPAEMLFPEDMTITIRKSGNQPMSINVVKGPIDVTISGEQLDQLVEQYKPYVIEMLKNGLRGVQPSAEPDTDGPSPGVDLGNPASELGEAKESLDDVVPEVPKLPE